MKYILFLSTIISLIACHEKEIKKEKPEFILAGDYIIIPDSSTLKRKIKTLKINPEPFSKTIQAPAVIEGNPTKLARITAPLAGRILKIYVTMGQKVSKGDLLFSMDAPDYVEAQKNYLSAKQHMLQSDLNYKRQKDLSANGVGVQKDLEEAETDMKVKGSEMEDAIARMRLYGIDPERMKIGSPLTVEAPVSGRVSGIVMTPGQFKSDLSEVIMVVADLSEVWITANVKEKDIQYMQVGDDATAQVAAYPDKVYKGKVLFIDDILSTETHALKVRVEMPNPDRELKPGMFASVTFIDSPIPSILIPADAILQKEDKNFVFVQVKPSTYQRRYIEKAETFNGKILILKGLNENDVIVSEGSFYLLNAK
jgi:cobalt-zinc-cadmium efflux system membrane fusion protein